VKVGWVYLLPRNTLILFLLGYRKVISPLYGNVCRYYPSCSSYGLQQLQQRGVLLGLTYTALRILRCNPWSQGGVDEVKASGQRFEINKSGFVTPNYEKGK
jgi:hypothetical protein